jgi:hypothetical protein
MVDPDRLGSKVMVPLGHTSRSACRSEPAALSLVLVTTTVLLQGIAATGVGWRRTPGRTSSNPTRNSFVPRLMDLKAVWLLERVIFNVFSLYGFSIWFDTLKFIPLGL